LVIADAQAPIALAGIMGGAQSEISGATRNLLLESAYFDPVSIGRTARYFQMRTEASHRFERGSNIEGTLPALARCVELILQLAGGTLVAPLIDLRPSERTATEGIQLRKSRLKRYGLIDVPDEFVSRTLNRLGFQTERNSEGWRAVVPAHRIDVTREEDLIEEVLRHYGYDRIPGTSPRWSGKGNFLPERELRFLVAELCRALGYSEALNWSFADPEVEALFDNEESPVTLKNPLSVEASQLRTHLIPNLVLAARHNQNHGQETVRLFEVGKVFSMRGGHIREIEQVAWVAMGPENRKYWLAGEDPVNYFYMKGVWEALSNGCRVEGSELRPAQARFLNPAQSAEIFREGRRVGFLGSLHPAVQASLKFKQPVYVGEFQLDPAPLRLAPSLYRPLGRFPSVFRDFSFLVDRTVDYQSLRDLVLNLAVPNLSQVELIDLYDSEHLPAGKISLALRFFFENPERTLTDEEIQASRDLIAQSLQTEFGIIPR
jgi:phenylalanyl-tRNA synthetase beta chain